VSGAASMTTPFQTAAWLVAGTVNGDTLMLYEGPGTVCSTCQLSLFFRGIIASGGSQLSGGFVSGGSPITLLKQ
jgi:hypothetical protein